jgi:hypothetical protein
VEGIERRVAWVGLILAVTVGSALTHFWATAFSPLGSWELVFVVAHLACLGIASALLVLAIAPTAVRTASLDERERFVFYAFALWVLAVLVIVGLDIHAAIDAHRHPGGS